MTHQNRPQEINFDPVVIRFTRQIYYDDSHTFQLEVRQTPVPLPGGAFRANVEEQLEQFQQTFRGRVAMNQFLYRYTDLQTNSADQVIQAKADLAALGQQLYDLLPESFRLAFPRLVQQVFEQGHGVRLIIEARVGDQADRLLNLPWEILFFQDTRVYLARSPRILIVRHLLEAVRRSPLPMIPPFNLAHIIADMPAGPPHYRIDEKLQQIERDTICQAVAPGLYQLVECPGSVEHMQAELRTRPYQIVHFLGHGEILGANQRESSPNPAARGYLRFVNANSQAQWVSGEQLQHLLGLTPTVQLVVLNACHGGSNVAGNIALDLVYSGLPYVVAMQSEILQEATQHFIQAFYTELQTGRSIEYAVAAGRFAIAANMPETIDWCLPVFYTNVGLPEKPALVSAGEQLWQWVSHPLAKYQLSLINLAFGALLLIVGLLLLLGGAAPPLPEPLFMTWVSLSLLGVPPLLTLWTCLSGQLSVPDGWPPSTRMAFYLRLFASASIGLGLPTLYLWLGLILLASFGFWSLLTPATQWIAQGILLGPGFLWSILFSYSQIYGQGRAFITNAHVQLPKFEWVEWGVVATGYGMLLAPLLILWFWPALMAPPFSSIICGLLLLAQGLVLGRNTSPDA